MGNTSVGNGNRFDSLRSKVENDERLRPRPVQRPGIDDPRRALHVLFRLVRKHWRREGRAPQALAADVDLTDPECYSDACDERFRQSWRDELLARTWEDLAVREHTYFTVLHFRAAHPDLAIDEMLDELSQQLGKPLTAQGVRQTLHRARKLFTRLLMQQIAGSLEFPSPQAIHEELRDLDLATFVLAPRKD